MPRNPRSRRRRPPRRLPPRPPAGARAVTAARPPADGGTSVATETRPERLVERETPFLRAELRRVAAVSSVCFALLAVLVVVDRLS